MRVIELDEDTNTKVRIFLLKHIEDTIELRKKIITGDLDCCAVKPAYIVNSFQIAVAANKAVVKKRAGKLATKCLNTELLYNLSISRNITESLVKFGISDNDENIIIVIFEENGENKFEQIKHNFKGEIFDLNEIENLPNVELIKKTYKISDSELQVSNLLDSVVTRISTKDLGSF